MWSTTHCVSRLLDHHISLKKMLTQIDFQLVKWTKLETIQAVCCMCLKVADSKLTMITMLLPILFIAIEVFSIDTIKTSLMLNNICQCLRKAWCKKYLVWKEKCIVKI